ncbi:hypothetical protein MPSEU_000789600 [Mayamaea pseudoterrestris]|nr:hypothetical protein MPSEU_000789600 [Mayamaea pseudoterrestris]
MSKTIDIVVLAVCGLPGSGKSRLCRSIAERCQEQIDEDASMILSCQVIEYDNVQKQLYEFDVKYDKNGSDQTTYNDAQLQAWRLSRTKALEQLSIALLTNLVAASTSDTSSGKQKPTAQLILLDDNFYLTSMRKQIYKTCQQALAASTSNETIHFGVVHLDTSLDTCLERNQAREATRIVPASVIRTMASRFEAPGKCSPAPYWESACLRVREDDTNDALTATMAFIKSFIHTGIGIVIPLPSLAEQAAKKREEQLQTLATKSHQVDLVLRRRCVQFVAAWHPQHARLSNEIRKQVLAQQQQQQQQQQQNDGNVAACDAAVSSFWTMLLQQGDWTLREQDEIRNIASEDSKTYTNCGRI